MPRTTLTAQKLIPGGAAATYGAVDALGAQFRHTGREILHVKNASVGSINVTPIIGEKVLGLSVTSPADAIAAGADEFFANFTDEYEQDDGNQTIFVDFSAVASVTVALLTL